MNLKKTLLVLDLKVLAKGLEDDCIAIEVKPIRIDEFLELDD